MRIISGVFNRRVLKSPETNKVRPTSDRAKETLFNILNIRIDFSEMTILDLFCGTGSLGLECLSRGASKCFFIDTDIKTVRINTELLKVSDKSEIIRSDVLEFLKSFDKENTDLVFCDPPYDYKDYSKLVECISLLKTVLILEHSGKFKLNEEFEKYVIHRKKVGTVNFTIFDFNTN